MRLSHLFHVAVLGLTLTACAGAADRVVAPTEAPAPPSWEEYAAPPADGIEMTFEQPAEREVIDTQIPGTQLKPERAAAKGHLHSR